MSLITFRSPTQGSVIMFDDNAQQLLTTLGLSAAGELTTAELPGLIARLQSAMATDKAQNPIVWPEEPDADIDQEAPVVIRFSQRASPLLQLMQRCLSATETIRWPA